MPQRIFARLMLDILCTFDHRELVFTAEPELQRRLVEIFRQDDRDASDPGSLLDPFQYVASANYVVPMLLDLAIKRGNDIVDHVPAYSSLDHSVNWQTFVLAVKRFEKFAAPYFETAFLPDPFAEELLEYERSKLARKHYIASFEQGLWSLGSDSADSSDTLRVRLAEPIRRSALHLVSQIAERALIPSRAAELLDRPEAERPAYEFALAADTWALDVFSQSTPESWNSFAISLGFPVRFLPSFRSWVLEASLGGMRWASMDTLWQDWTAFSSRRGLTSYGREEFESIVSFHTVTPDEAISWGVQAPFLRLENFLALWPFAFHVLYPDLGFLSLAVRRRQQLWNNTVGSTLASAAEWVGQKIPAYPRLSWAACSRRQGIGDADLVLLDRESGHVIVAELKTTYDKFRSHVQLNNYVNQRVNFPRAATQAQSAASAIRDGRWPLRDLFGASAPPVPQSVSVCVLTWWDTFNPTLGTGKPILCCNFATFLHIVSASGGDLAATTSAIRELASIYCPGRLIRGSFQVDGQERVILRELQSANLPPTESWPSLSTLTTAVIAPFRPWPANWREQLRPDEEYFVYQNDDKR